MAPRKARETWKVGRAPLPGLGYRNTEVQQQGRAIVMVICFFQNTEVSFPSPPTGKDLVPVRKQPFSCLSSLFSDMP